MQDDPVSKENAQGLSERRSFLKWLIGIVALINALLAGIPFLGAMIGSSRRKKETGWVKVADIRSIPVGGTAGLRFSAPLEEAFFHERALHSIWVVKHSSSEVTVFSPVCTHLGCYFQWNEQTGHFECPCHASVFSREGRVLAGPAPRPLDTLPARIENNELFVKWERFRVGRPEKIQV
jgi:menaquinol-cytochrome c reductase iron-sulfur subunit